MNFNNETPIYLQIIEYMKLQIIKKVYLPNEKIPSVRELSLQFEVNPNTIQKSLSELETMGLIYTERTNGKFVTNNEFIIENLKKQTIDNLINNFYKSMENIGINKERAFEILSNKEKL